MSHLSRAVRYITDDFGNQWKLVTTGSGLELHYEAPTQHLEDDLHDAWGGWNTKTLLRFILDKYVDDRGNLMSPAGIVNDIRGLL